MNIVGTLLCEYEWIVAILRLIILDKIICYFLLIQISDQLTLTSVMSPGFLVVLLVLVTHVAHMVWEQDNSLGIFLAEYS